MSQAILTEREKEKIRLKENLRHDIRVSQRSRIWWFNTPITIWLLTVIVVPLFTYFHSEYKNGIEVEKEERQIRRDITAKLHSEIEFRVAQFNKVLGRAQLAREAAAKIPDKQLMEIISNSEFSDNGLKKLQELFLSAPLLRVTSELGGIYTIPKADEKATVWIGHSGLGNSALPDERGYLDENYINDSLFSLWKKLETVKGKQLSRSKEGEVKKLFDRLELAAKPTQAIETLPGISANESEMQKWSENVDLSAVKNLRESTSKWIRDIEAAWQEITDLLLI